MPHPFTSFDNCWHLGTQGADVARSRRLFFEANHGSGPHALAWLWQLLALYGSWHFLLEWQTMRSLHTLTFHDISPSSFPMACACFHWRSSSSSSGVGLWTCWTFANTPLQVSFPGCATQKLPPFRHNFPHQKYGFDQTQNDNLIASPSLWLSKTII